MAPDPGLVEGVPILTALDSAEVPILTAPDSTEGVPILTSLDLMEGVSMLMAPDSTEGVPMLTGPDHRTKGMPVAFLTTPDPKAVPVEVGRPAEEDLLSNLASYYVRAAAGLLANDESCPGLSAPSSAGEGHLNLCPMARYYVLAAASPLLKDRRSTNKLASLGEAAPAPAQAKHHGLTVPGSAAHSPCLLSSPATHSMATNASVTQLSHPRLHPPRRYALRVFLVLMVQEL